MTKSDALKQGLALLGAAAMLSLAIGCSHDGVASPRGTPVTSTPTSSETSPPGGG